MLRSVSCVVLALGLLAACGGSPAGTWECDQAGTVGQVRRMVDVALADVPEDAEEQAEAALAPLLQRVRLADSRFELDADGECRLLLRPRRGAAQRLEGSWAMTGEQVTMTFTVADEDGPFVVAATFDGDNLIVLEDVAAKEVRTRFRRVGG